MSAKKRHNLSTKEGKAGMSDEMIVRQCAPTLAGIKTGSLFPCPYESRTQLMDEIRAMNHMLVPKGLCMLPVRCEGGSALLYVYRPGRLQQDLQNDLAQRLLQKAGYSRGGCALCVSQLVQRLRRQEDFPHEVGLFLSYPPEDVKGFIDHRANDFKCAGLWKVYGDEEKARSLFEKYRKCTEIYCTLWQSGLKLEQLAVAV